MTRLHLLRYPMWIWAGLSLLAWVLLPAATLKQITPWVCGALLLAAAGNLGLMCHGIRKYARARGALRKRYQNVIAAAVTTAVAGIACWIVLPTRLGSDPDLGICATVWLLCSAGFVLSLLVARLVLSFIGELPPHHLLDELRRDLLDEEATG